MQLAARLRTRALVPRPLGRGLRAAPPAVRPFSASAAAVTKKHHAQARLMFASSEGDCDLISDLVAKGVDCNSVDYANRTALHVAAGTGHLPTVKALVAAGANLNALDNENTTPLGAALAGKHSDVTAFLFAQGARLNPDRVQDQAEMMLNAAAKGDCETLTHLLDCGVDPNLCDYDMRYPLHIAAAEGKLEACELLLSRGADLNPVDRFGGTPLGDCQRLPGRDHVRTSEMLIARGATVVASNTGFNYSKLNVAIQDSLSLFVEHDRTFALCEAWLPTACGSEFVAHEYWYALPAQLETVQRFAGSRRGKSVSEKNVDPAFRECWEQGKGVVATELNNSNVPGRLNLAQQVGLEAMVLIPLHMDLEGGKRRTGVLKFYTFNKESARARTAEQDAALALFCSRTVEAGYHGTKKPPSFPAMKGLATPSLPQDVYRLICQTKAYNPCVVYFEVHNFFNLQVHPSYFNTFDVETIARHIAAFIGAKKFAYTTMDRESFWMEVQNNQDFMGGTVGNVTTGPEQAITMCQLNHKKQLASERRLQGMIDRLPLNYSFNLNFYQSGRPPIVGSEQPLGLYVLRSEEYPEDPSKDPAALADSDDLSKVAGIGFLKRNSQEIIDRYQMILTMATQTLAPVYKVLPADGDGEIPTILAMRGSAQSFSRNGESIITAMTEVMSQLGLTASRRSCLRFANGFIVFHTHFSAGSSEADVRKLMDAMCVMQIIPASDITNLFLTGAMSTEDYIYSSCAGRFVYYFVNQRSEEFEALCSAFKDSKSNLGRLKSLHTRLKREAVSMTRITQVVAQYPDLINRLSKDFHDRTNSAWTESRPLDPALERSIESKAHTTLDAQVLMAMHLFNRCVLKTNINKREKSAISFRLSCEFLEGTEYSRRPYGVFFLVSHNFQGFHVRFRDVARGGIRLIVSRNRSHYNKNLGTLFAENYGLAYTQNNKNKDIPEFGSKGTVLLGANVPPAQGFNAFQSYISGLMDLLVIKEEDKIFDNYNKTELLFLGPDEGTANWMRWAAEYAESRGYSYWKALTTGKPPLLGGIPHDTYGMTTRSVHRYVVGTLEKLGLDESEVTKVQTGGPDGDLGSNEILISKDKTKCIVDGAGVVYDPAGLNRQEMERLAHKRSMIDGFDESKLGPGGFKVLVTDTNVTLPSGEVVESGLALRNDFHLHPLFEADVFVPCGGRPESINLNNVHKYINADGTPRFKIICEGANLFFTNDARDVLESHGCYLFKDASTNKGGVTSSSFEVLAALAFPEDEFQIHMSAKDPANPPEFYKRYAQDIQDKVEYLADLEFEAVWKERQESGEKSYIITEKLSEKINELTDFVAESDMLWQNLALRKTVLSEAVPRSLVDHLGIDAILKNVPENYLRASFATYLASRYVYKFGLHANEFSFFEFMQDLYAQSMAKKA